MSGVLREEFSSGRQEIVLARPEHRNALDAEAVAELALAVRASQGAAVIVVRGEGGSFSSGGDLNGLHALPADQLRATLALMRTTLEGLGQLPQLVVAWVEGVALGGGLELALAADLVWLAPSARLRAAQLEMGLLPGWGGMAAARRRLGEARARALYLDPRWISAEEALAAGLADRVLPDLAAMRAEADRLAGFSGQAVAAIKQGREPTPELFAQLWDGSHHRQAVARFHGRSRPKRPPMAAGQGPGGGEQN